MYALVTYPLDVIKTHRILETNLHKTAGESIPKEFAALCEAGGMAQGAFRGLGSAAAIGIAAKMIPFKDLWLAAPAISAVQNPLLVMQVYKQQLGISYGEAAAKAGSGMFTRGLIPLAIRNYFLLYSVYPSQNGINYTPYNVALAVGSIVISHPFEVCRVLLHADKGWNGFHGTLNTLYNQEGLAGFYRGFAPRFIQLLPLLLIGQQVIGQNDVRL